MSAGRVLHPVLSPARRRELVREGAELFHAGKFFEAHEAWEEVWRSTTPEPRDLFQGLVQLAAAFHHLHARRRPDVARRVLAKARRRLAVLVGARASGPERSTANVAASDRRVEGADRFPFDAARDSSLATQALIARLDEWDSWLATATGEAPPVPRLDWLHDLAAPPADQPDDSGRRAT